MAVTNLSLLIVLDNLLPHVTLLFVVPVKGEEKRRGEERRGENV